MTQEMTAAGDREYPPYHLMVQRLFKVMPDVPFASAMHAAIGLSGEAAEWLAAASRKDIIEEGGDIEFYIEALKQQIKADVDGALALNIVDLRAANLTIGAVFNNVVTLTGDIIDQVKKSWVYQKELNRSEITRLLIILEMNVEAIYKIIGVSREHVKHLNKVKLIGPGGRFESGFYSDSAAIRRADKQPGEDRSFFGKAGLVVPSDPTMPTGKMLAEHRFEPVAISKLTASDKESLNRQGITLGDGSKEINLG